MQIPEVPRKAARKQAMAVIATMIGTLVMARVAGNGDFSDEILDAGREAVLGRAAPGKAGRRRNERPKTPRRPPGIDRVLPAIGLRHWSNAAATRRMPAFPQNRRA